MAAENEVLQLTDREISKIKHNIKKEAVKIKHKKPHMQESSSIRSKSSNIPKQHSRSDSN